MGHNSIETIQDGLTVTDDMGSRTLVRAKSDRAPGRDDISNRVFKGLGIPLVHALRTLIQGCWDWQHHQKSFQVARRVVLREPQTGLQ